MKFSFLIILIAGTLWGTACSDAKNPYEHHSAEADRLIQSALKDSLFAGSVLLVSHLGDIIHHRAYGHAALYDREGRLHSDPELMTTEHQFDLASLTKIFSATYGIMYLHSNEQLHIDDRVCDYLEPFDSDEKRNITIRHLLSHTSGLMQWHPTYYNAENKEERLKFIGKTSLSWEIGETRRYSDLGFMVLGDLIETVSGQNLDDFLSDHIFAPLSLEMTLFNPGVRGQFNIVSTSHGNPFEKKMVYEDDFGFTVNVDPGTWDGWRDYILQGEVNDGNAFHTHDGIAGHAGLYSTAGELYKLLQPVLDQHPGIQNHAADDTELFSAETIKRFLTPDEFGHGLGWMMTSASLHAEDLPEGSFGHTGFTGTNLLVVPEEELVIIFLTNRQHYDVDETGNYPDLREIRTSITNIFLNPEEPYL